MHKDYLTKSECEVIKGADDIVREFGGFPSMENGSLLRVDISRNNLLGRFDIELTFDIAGWKETMQMRHEPINSERRIIKIRFECVEDFAVKRPLMESCCEIKFDNKTGVDEIYRDSFPGNAKDFPRPYSRFYMFRWLVVEFCEETCRINAWFE